MKILFLGIRDAAEAAGGVGSAYKSFYLPLKKFGEVILYPLERLDVLSQDAVEKELLDVCQRKKPDAVFCWTHPTLDPRLIKRITEETKIVTVGIFGDDDSGFFDCWNKFAGGVFDWEITFYPPALEWHRKLGGNVVGMHVIVNDEIFKPKNGVVRNIDVSFVGNASPQRRSVVKELKRRGVEVKCFGRGWVGGMVPLGEMVDIFRRTKINLNMAGTPLHSWTNVKSLARLFLRKKTNAGGRLRVLLDIRNIGGNFLTFKSLMRPICRERLFEIIATNSFLLTSKATYFPGFFYDGEEIIHYGSIGDLAEKIRYYLEHDAERGKIAQAAYDKFRKNYASSTVLKKLFGVIYHGDPKERANKVVVL